MGRPSKQQLNDLKNILSNEIKEGKKFFNRRELKQIYEKHQENHNYATFKSFLSSALNNGFLHLSALDFPDTKYYRFFNKAPNIYEVCMSIHKKAYFSHYTAVFMHELTLNIPKVIYVNLEQTPKIKQYNDLNQLNINKAFYRRPRRSNNYTQYNQHKIYLLKGKHTNRLEVIEKELTNNTIIKTTSIERTLIDIAVSPYYCGGITEVLNVYKTAQGQFSTRRLAEILKKLDYSYPFHQVIGFYLDKASYHEKDLKIFEDFGINYKFFIDRQIEKRKLDKRWNLYHPEFF